MAGRVRGKVAVVTGAGSVGEGIGNGKAAAILYAREGASVLLVDRELEAAEETRSLIAEEGGVGLAHRADVSRAEECQGVVDRCLEAFGRVDILHNNVGIEIAGGLEDTTEEDWRRTLDVNLTSMFLLARGAVPHMERQGSGSIVNISSINAIRTLPALSLAYAVSKAGVIALTREIAVEYAAKGIRVNAILPGMMKTPFVVSALTEAWGGDVQAMMERRDRMCPTGRQGESWDVAHASLFLASDEARYVTGTTLVVDGAQTARIAAEVPG
jgi:NAD(P)-dependent dehydrogenase (short-subunit alcohol dehydrogenase family)